MTRTRIERVRAAVGIASLALPQIEAAPRSLRPPHRTRRAAPHPQHPATTPATTIAELVAQHATHLAHLTEEPLAATGSDLIDQLREGEERLGRAGIQGGGALGVAAGLLDQALDMELDGGTQLDQEVTVVHAASLLCGLAGMTAEYRRTAA